MKKYFIEFGPEHNRTFIDKPPKRPLGKIKEVTEKQWLELKSSHPSTWKFKENKIHISFSFKEKIFKTLILLIGILIGYFLH